MKIYTIILLSMFSTCIAMEKPEEKELNKKEGTLLSPIWKNHGKLPKKTYEHFAKELITNMKIYLPKQNELYDYLKLRKDWYGQAVIDQKLDQKNLIELNAISLSMDANYEECCEVGMIFLNKSIDERQRTRAGFQLHKIITVLAEASMCEICNCKEITTHSDIDKWVGRQVPTVSKEKKEEALKKLYNEKDFHLSVLMEGYMVMKYAFGMLQNNNKNEPIEKKEN